MIVPMARGRVRSRQRRSENGRTSGLAGKPSGKTKKVQFPAEMRHVEPNLLAKYKGRTIKNRPAPCSINTNSCHATQSESPALFKMCLQPRPHRTGLRCAKPQPPHRLGARWTSVSRLPLEAIAAAARLARLRPPAGRALGVSKSIRGGIFFFRSK